MATLKAFFIFALFVVVAFAAGEQISAEEQDNKDLESSGGHLLGYYGGLHGGLGYGRFGHYGYGGAGLYGAGLYGYGNRGFGAYGHGLAGYGYGRGLYW